MKMTSLASFSISSHGSTEPSDTRKYVLIRDTVAKSKWPSGSRARLLSKKSEQRVLKGSLWQEADYSPLLPPPSSTSKSKTGVSSPIQPLKYQFESLEIEDVTLQCPIDGFLMEITEEECRLLLAIPTSEERYKVFADKERMASARFINVGSDVIVCKRNVPACRATIRWKGRLAGKQGVWFGVEIMDEQSRGSGETDGSINKIKLFDCEKGNGMFVNIGHLTLVPPKRPTRKQKKHAPSTPSQGSELTNGSDQLTNDILSQTESDLSFDINSVDTVPLVNLQINDRVVWPAEHGYEAATVRWIGTLPEEESLQGEILVGVEFDNPIGKGTGVYKNRRLFEAPKGHASLVPMDGLVKLGTRAEPSSGSHQSEPNESHLNDASGPLEKTVTCAEVLAAVGIEDTDGELSSDHNNNNGERSQNHLDEGTPRVEPSNHSEERAARLEVPIAVDVSHSPRDTYSVTTNGPTYFSATGSSQNSLSSDNVTCDSCEQNNHSKCDHNQEALRLSPHTGPNGWSDSCDSGVGNHDTVDQSSPIPNSPAKTTNGPIDSQLDDEIEELLNRNGLLMAHGQADTKEKPKANNRRKLTRTKVPVRNNIKKYSAHKEVKRKSISPRRTPRTKQVSDLISLEENDEVFSLDYDSDSQPTQEGNNGAGVVDLLADDLQDLSIPVMQAPAPPRGRELVMQAPPPPVNGRELVTQVAPPLNGREQIMQASSPQRGRELVKQASPLREQSPRESSEKSKENTPATSMENSLEGVPPPEPFMTPPPPYPGDMEHPQYRGIQGSAEHSSYIETILFCLCVSTNLLTEREQRADYGEIRRYLQQHIIEPIERYELVRCTVVTQLRQMLNEISIGQMLKTGEQRDIQKFLRLLLEHIYYIKPLYELSNDQTGYTLSLALHKDARTSFPTIQQLLERSFAQQQVKFNQVPACLILLLPRWTHPPQRIFPNMQLDLTGVLEYAMRPCHMCGEQALFECPECYESEANELAAAVFCEPCSQTMHKHSKRANHLPVQLRSNESVDATPLATLTLTSIISVNGGEFSAITSTRKSEVLEEKWLNYNSKSESQGEHFVPNVMDWPDVGRWLSVTGYDRIAKDMDSVPEHIQSVFSDCCVCIYQQRPAYQ